MQDFAKNTMEKFPELALELIKYATDIYHEKNKQGGQTIATKLAFSRLKMQAAQIRLRLGRYSLFDVRSELFHNIPVIQELNFIIILIKTKNYLKATLFLTELAPLFIGERIDSRLALPFYELACLGYLGQKQYSKALEALDHGYALCQKLSKTSFQAVRYITFFEKIIKLFEDSQQSTEGIQLPEIEQLIVPGYIFDKAFLTHEMCPDPNGILVEL
jgi:hypothetical protein